MTLSLSSVLLDLRRSAVLKLISISPPPSRNRPMRAPYLYWIQHY